MRKRDLEKEGCASCNVVKPLEEYAVKRHGRATTCKQCSCEYQKQYRKTNAERVSRERADYYQKNKERIRSARLESEYGLPAGSYEQMLIAQERKCAICGSEDWGGGKGYFCVDHNHITGQIRKLLCSSCNKLIGFAKENPATLRQAALYLEKENDSNGFYEGKIGRQEDCS